MNRLFYVLLAVLSLIVIFLSKSIFFGANSYNKRAELIEDSKIFENVTQFKNLVQFLKLEGVTNFKDLSILLFKTLSE